MTFKTILVLFALLVSSSLIIGQDAPEKIFVNHDEQEIYEEFALSQNREEVIKKLIPGTEIYYFLHTLYYQQNSKIKEAGEMIIKWEERLPTSQQVIIMKNRQSLLDFDKKPKETYQFLKEKLSLNFDHIKPITTDTLYYPTILNPNVYSYEEDLNHLLSTSSNLSTLSEKGLFEISKRKLTPEQLQSLLNLYPHCDLPNLTDLILTDFVNFEKRLFGDLKSHLKLTISQLDELKKKKPSILTHNIFVIEYLAKLNTEKAQLKDYNLNQKKKLLQECWAFSKDLNPSFNTLKANILFAYLKVCLELNQPDNVLFGEFLKLPRQAVYSNVDFYQKKSLANEFIQFDKKFAQLYFIPPINSDVSLIESYLFKLIKTSTNLSEYQIYFDKAYLNKFEAESKIQLGLGKPEEFYNILKTSDLENLKNSVELSFTEHNPKIHLINSPIALSLQIKNINELEIQVYQLNMLDFYRTKNAEINLDISLEGYIPNIIKKISYKQPSYIRHEESIDLSEITKPGVYIIELLGNGIKTRTFIRKGTIFPVISDSNFGQEIQLFDDSQNQIINYAVYFGKHEFKSDDKGIVLLSYAAKYSSDPKKLVFSFQDIACLFQFYHNADDYRITNLILNDSESLVPGQNCKIPFKPCLKLNGNPINLSILKNIKVKITTSNFTNEVLSSKTFFYENLKDYNEIPFFVPESATHLEILISGNVLKKSNDEDQMISVRNEILLSGAYAQSNIRGIYFKKQKDNYHIECLNKAGVPQANVCVSLSLFGNFLRKEYKTTLQTDKNGIINLGKLESISYIEASGVNEKTDRWHISNGYIATRPKQITVLENEPLELPIQSINIKTIAESLLFLRQNGETIVENKTPTLKIENEILKIPTDIAGEYVLSFKDWRPDIQIYILKGKKNNKYYMSEDKISDILPHLNQQITIDSIDESKLIIKGKILNTNKNLKAYLWSGRYCNKLPDFVYHVEDTFELHPNHYPLAKQTNEYFDSIKLSSEQKYIFNRKDIIKFPGNLLITPSSLLNPWDTSLADGALEGGAGGGSYATRSGGGRKRAVMKGGGSKSSESSMENNSLAFLPNTSIIEIPIQQDGTFEVNFKEFKDQCYFKIGVISPNGFIIKELDLESTNKKILDIRQTKGNSTFDGLLPLKSISVIQPDKPITFLQGEEKEIVLIDSISKLHSALKVIIGHDQALPGASLDSIDSFNFLTKWNSFTEAQKLTKYKEFACHEVHFFIYQKDLAFFIKHIKPYLKNKQVKSLIDKWLLDEDLSSYLNLNKFNQLNLFEKILLAKRHPDIKEKMNSYIKDYLEINKPNRAKENNLMERLLSAESGKNASVLLNNADAGITAPMESKTTNQSTDLQEEIVVETIVDEKDSVLPIVESSEMVDKKAHAEDTFYRDVNATKEYAEANYYHLEKHNETNELIMPNSFWYDYLNNPNKNFISNNILCLTNLHEAILALALTDIPESSEKITTEVKENQITIFSKIPVIVLLNAFKSGILKPGAISIQQHYSLSNQDQDNKKILDANKSPFLINKKYDCMTIITNTTAETIDYYLNNFIPEGSLPLGATIKKELKVLKIEPFTSSVFENHFFFPLSGNFTHLPAIAVNFDNTIIYANEKSYAITATANEEELDKDSWEYQLKEGNKEKILAYIKSHNILKLNLEDIYYLAKDKSFFEAITTELKARYYFDFTIWSFSVYHKDKNKLLEFLPNTELAESCGGYFASHLLNVDPIDNREYEHKEYFPLIKSRSHPLDNGNNFENLQFEEHYQVYINLLMHKSSLTNSDFLNITIYAINQQRISDAIKYFAQIKESEISEKLQYDYLKAYLAFYQDDLKTSEKILSKYKDLTILQWKEKFDELAIQLNEIKTGDIDAKARGDKFSSTVLADREAILKTKNNLGNIEIAYKNLKQCRVDYYETDLEILFSNSPFEVMNNQFQFLTLPNISEVIVLKENTETHSLKIPGNLKNKNLVIKVVGAGKESVVNYYPNQMDITLSENYGELRVLSSESKKPLSGVYVKVYGESGNGKDFVKDGYTDLRGIFNYSSVSGKPIKQFKKLAILILSEKHGAAIQYTTPPAQ